MALLRSDECVSYARFDGALGPYDHKNNIALSGAITFGSGILGQSFLGIGARNIFGPQAVFCSGTTSSASMCNIDATRVLICYADSNDGNYGKAVIGSVSGDTISFGAVTTFLSGGAASQIKVIALSPTNAIVCYQDGSASEHGLVRVCSISGTDITWGNTAEFYSSFGNFAALDATRIHTSGFVVVYKDNVDSEHGKSRVGIFDGTNISFGSVTDFFSTGIATNIAITSTTSAQVIVAYTDGNSGNNGKAKVGTIAGNVISWGSATTFDSSGPVSNVAISTAGTTVGGNYRIVISWYRGQFSGTWPHGASRRGVLTGGSLSWDTSYTQIAYSYNLFSKPSIIQIDNDTVVVGFQKTYGSVSVGQTNSVDNLVYWSNPDTFYPLACNTLLVTKCDGDKFVVGCIDSNNIGRICVGSIVREAKIMTTNSAPKSSVGQTGVAVVGWYQNPSVGSSRTIISRGYEVSIIPTHITLGSGTSVAYWDDASISYLLGQLNDGDKHFLSMYFSNVSGGIWDFTTSIDGSGYVSHGTQDTGYVPISTANTPLAYTNQLSTLNTWVDENAMWFTPVRFSDYQTTSMYGLTGSGFNLSSYTDKIEAVYSGIVPFTLYGPTQITGEMPCLVKAEDLPYEISGAVFYHPLNDRKEWIKKQTWYGPGTFVDGQVSGALSFDLSQNFSIPASGAIRMGIAYTIPYIRIAPMDDDRAITLTGGGSQHRWMGIAASGGIVASGIELNTGLTAAACFSLSPLGDDRAFSLSSFGGGNYAFVVKMNPDLSITSGTRFYPTTFGAIRMYPFNTICLRASGGYEQNVVASFLNSTNQTNIYLYTTSGMYVTGRESGTYDGWNYGRALPVVTKIDDSHFILCHGRHNRMNVIRLNDDNSLTYGRDVRDYSMPITCHYSYLLNLGGGSGIWAYPHKINTVNKNAYVPVLLTDTGIKLSDPPESTQYSNLDMGYGFYGHPSYDSTIPDNLMCKIDETSFVTFNNTLVSHQWYWFRNNQSGISVITSGLLSAEPIGGTDDRAGYPTVSNFNPGGALFAWRRLSDNTGVCRFIAIQDSMPISGNLSVFTSNAPKFITAINHGTSGAIICYHDTTDANTLKATYASVSGLSMSFSSPIVYDNGRSDNYSWTQKIINIDTDKFAVFYNNTNGQASYCLLTVSGTSLSCGSGTVFDTSTAGYSLVNLNAINLGNNSLAIFGSKNYSVSGSGFVGITASVSGDTIVFSPTQTTILAYNKYSSSTYSPCWRVSPVYDNNKLYFSWCDNTVLSSEPQGYAIAQLGTIDEDVIGVSGDRIFGRQVDTEAYIELYYGMCKINDNTILNGQCQPGTIAQTYPVWFQPLRIDTSGLTISPILDPTQETQAPGVSNDLAMLSNNRAIYAGYSSTALGFESTCITFDPVSGTVSVGDYLPTSWPISTRPHIVNVGEDRAAYGVVSSLPNNRLHVGWIYAGLSGALVAPNSDQYQSTIGKEQFMLMLWSKNPSISGSTFWVERDVKIQLLDNKVRFGTNTVEWETTELSGLLSTINNGQPHFLIVDIQHSGDGIWSLRTSLDGTTWVDHGVQTSGIELPPSGNSNAQIFMSPEREYAPSIWLDEVYLYAGQKGVDLNTFEIEKAYSLGAIKHIGLDNYGASPASNANSIDLFLKSACPFISSSGAVFYQTYERYFDSQSSGNAHEHILGEGWIPSTTSLAAFTSGVAGSGGLQTSNGTLYWYEPIATTARDRLYNGQNYTMVTWWDCNRGGGLSSDFVGLGQGSPIYHGLTIQSSGTSGFILNAVANGVTYPVNSIQTDINQSKAFVAGRIEFVTGEIIGLLSINGSPWYSGSTPYAGSRNNNSSRYGVYTYIAPGVDRACMVDESILWKDIDRFSQYELNGLYMLGLQGLTIACNSADGFDPIEVSNWAPLFIGSLSKNSEIPLYITGPKCPISFSGLIYYHECNSDNLEWVKGKEWSLSGAIHVPYFIDEGVSVSGGDTGFYSYVDTDYQDPRDLYDLTALCWISGVQHSPIYCDFGWFSGITPVNSVGFQTTGSGVGFVLNSSGVSWSSGTYYALQYNPTIAIVRTEFSGGLATSLVSIDGNAWVDMGQTTISTFDSSGNIIGAKLIQSYPTGELNADELALWGNIDRFTPYELQQLYYLGMHLRKPLYEFHDVFDGSGLHVESSCPLYIYHSEVASGCVDGFVNGHTEYSLSLDLSIPFFTSYSGIPYPLNAIYTHPLDDLREKIIDIDWSGVVAGFVPSDSVSGLQPSSDIGSASGYPSTIGASTLTWHMTALRPLDSGLYISTGRGYTLTTTKEYGSPSYIYLTNSTESGIASWYSSDITSLFDSIEGSKAHCIVFEFTHIIDGNWWMKISTDGRPYVDYGLQNSGSCPLSTIDTDPYVIVSGSHTSAWLDDVIMWTNTNLTNDDLRQFCHGASGSLDYMTLFMNGVPWSSSGSVDLFVSGYVLPPSGASGVYDFTIENLFRTMDYSPQIIGKLDCPASGSVYIEVWYCTDGNNDVVEITNSGCYPIGNTGRWGWSTAYLPDPWPSLKPQYYYRMTASNSNIFEGQFFMNTNMNRNRMPRNASEYTLNI